MTDDLNQSNLSKVSAAVVGRWSTIQRGVIRDTSLLMLALFRTRLQGAANKGLREALATVIPSSKDSQIRTELKVRIVR
jgi:hypothetical protein